MCGGKHVSAKRSRVDDERCKFVFSVLVITKHRDAQNNEGFHLSVGFCNGVNDDLREDCDSRGKQNCMKYSHSLQQA